jgi:hypothetical protein
MNPAEEEEGSTLWVGRRAETSQGALEGSVRKNRIGACRKAMDSGEHWPKDPPDNEQE